MVTYFNFEIATVKRNCMSDTYFLRIKKEYAEAVIQDLEKMDAVEVIDESNVTIPQWQVEKINAAKKNAMEHPSTLMDWDTIHQNIKCK